MAYQGKARQNREKIPYELRQQLSAAPYNALLGLYDSIIEDMDDLAEELRAMKAARTPKTNQERFEAWLKQYKVAEWLRRIYQDYFIPAYEKLEAKDKHYLWALGPAQLVFQSYIEENFTKDVVEAMNPQILQIIDNKGKHDTMHDWLEQQIAMRKYPAPKQ
jgi:hypothetical protein